MQALDLLLNAHRVRMGALRNELAELEVQREKLHEERDAYVAMRNAKSDAARAQLASARHLLHRLHEDPFVKPASADWRGRVRGAFSSIGVHEVHDVLVATVDGVAPAQYVPKAAEVRIVIGEREAPDVVELTGAIGSVVITDVCGIEGAGSTLRCAVDHVPLALCMLCVDAPSTLAPMLTEDAAHRATQELQAKMQTLLEVFGK